MGGWLVNALDEFRALGIDFVSLHEGVDTSTPNGRLVFGIFASIAEFERELIRDRVRSGLALARSRGRQLGRPRIVVDASRAAFLRAQGCSWAAISAEMDPAQGYRPTSLRWLAQEPPLYSPRDCLIRKGRKPSNLITQEQMGVLKKVAQIPLWHVQRTWNSLKLRSPQTPRSHQKEFFNTLRCFAVR